VVKAAVVYIEGEISGSSYTASIQGVRDQLMWQGQFDAIQVTINSHGGDIAEGLGIYDTLRSFNLPITTIVIGQCCSAATIVFLSGDERLIYENVVAFMVHQASGGAHGTADQLRTVADFIDSYNDRLRSIYMEKTKQDEEVVRGWMSEDTFMNAEQALANGFATMIAKPVEAKYTCSRPVTAIEPPVVTALAPTPTPPSHSPNQSTNPMKIIIDRTERFLRGVTAIAEGKTIVAKKVTTSTGEELDIDTVDEDDAWAEDDVVRKNGEPAPDGEYTVGNVTFVVKDGKIASFKADDSKDAVTASADATATTTDATPAVTASADEELTRLRSENELLKTQNATLTSTNTIVTAKLIQSTTILGKKESKDVSIPAPAAPDRTVTARASAAVDEDPDRTAMLEKRKNRGQPAPAATV
jgi:ATP-dependent Clp endopeptidase proteolytic subunit ClpP